MPTHPRLTKKEMFGGIAFMIGGNMAVGVSGDELTVRVGMDAHDQAVAKTGARMVRRLYQATSLHWHRGPSDGDSEYRVEVGFGEEVGQIA